jgi:allophanate hydrolase subunit 1
MALPIEFENELENWLTERLDERFARQQRAVLEGVIKMVAAMLNEQIKYDGAAREKELEQLGAKIQAALDRIQGVLEQQMARIDRAAHGEPVDSTKMN